MKLGTLIGILILAALLAAGVAWYFFGGQEIPEPDRVYHWPLTGEVAPGGDSIRTRVVSVKIENSSAARPQAGLADADVVYESLSEGGIPRLNVLYHSALPARVGPVRSARLSDTYLVPQYGALFSYSGASDAVRQRIGAAGIDDLGMESNPGLYERDPGRSPPHDVFTSAKDLQVAAAAAGFATVAAPRDLVFGEVPDTLAEAPPAMQVFIPFAGGNDVLWMWDEAGGRWLRDVAGMPHADEETSEPYSAANVIIMYAETLDTGLRDTAGSAVLDIRLDRSGEAVVLRDGRRFDVTWAASPNAPPRFETAEGTPFPLAVGKTWVEVVPTGYEVTIE